MPADWLPDSECPKICALVADSTPSISVLDLAKKMHVFLTHKRCGVFGRFRYHIYCASPSPGR